MQRDGTAAEQARADDQLGPEPPAPPPVHTEPLDPVFLGLAEIEGLEIMRIGI